MSKELGNLAKPVKFEKSKIPKSPKKQKVCKDR